MNRFLFPVLTVSLAAGAFLVSRSIFDEESSPAATKGPTSKSRERLSQTAAPNSNADTRRSPGAAPKTIIRRHRAPPSLSAQEQVSLSHPERINTMRNMVGLSLSERRDELRRCVGSEGLPFSTSTLRFHVDSSESSMTANLEEVIVVPDSLKQCIASEIENYEIAAEEGAPFLDGYSGTLDVSLTINEPS